MKENLIEELTYSLAKINTRQNRRLLNYILSPLEDAALRQPPDTFIYRINRRKIYISVRARQQIISGIVNKLSLLHYIIKDDHLKAGIPSNLREVFDDPAEILYLHYAIRNRLCRLDCFTLFSILEKGRDYFIKEQNFGKGAMKTLDVVFEKYGCGHLFV